MVSTAESAREVAPIGKSRYLFGRRITDSDIRLYATLVRFDRRLSA